MAVWVRIELSKEDRATLSMWANAGRTEQRLARVMHPRQSRGLEIA